MAFNSNSMFINNNFTKMIPKQIYDKKQLTLNNLNSLDTRKENLENYRQELYIELKRKLTIMNVQKLTLIKSYINVTKEIDNNLQSLK